MDSRKGEKNYVEEINENGVQQMLNKMGLPTLWM